MSLQVFAGGDINPCRFVKASTAADNTVLEADANERVIGISGEGAQDAPIPGASTLAAASGEQLQIINTPEHRCLLELGSGGATRGDLLKSDADGKGVAIATSGTTIQHYGAIALQAGSAGDKIFVLFRPGETRPALS